MSFSYDAKPGPAGPIGTCEVTGGTAADPVKVRCLDVTRYHRSGTKVRFTGHAIQDGAATSYTITVADGRGTNPDTFLIQDGHRLRRWRLRDGGRAQGPLIPTPPVR